MKFSRKPISILGILTLLTLSFSAKGQGVLSRRTLGNLNVPQLQRSSITPLSSGIEQQQLQNLTREQQIQLALLNGANLSDPKSRLPEDIALDSADLKDYVKKNIFRDTLIFGSELFRRGNLNFTPNLQLANAPNYLVGIGDRLSLTLYGNQEASYDLQVKPNGTLEVPYAGVFSVAGLKLQAVEARIKQKLIQSGYVGLQNGGTQLSLAVTGVRSIRVTVLGARNPGSYVVPSIATIMHVLYASGGPAKNGSYRTIELIRNNNVISTLDLYHFIATGKVLGDLVLEEGDVIRIPTYTDRVNLMGEFKRPGIFELKPNESFADILAFAGNFTEGAYKGQVLIFATGETELFVKDLAHAEFSSSALSSGDLVIALPLRNRYTNRVAVTGGVVRPGYYAWQEGMTFQELMEKAQGLDRQALESKASILRRPDRGISEYIEVDPSVYNEPIFADDSVYVSMYNDLIGFDFVAVQGHVEKPGKLAYFPGLTAEQAILYAGGIDQLGDLSMVEVANPILDEKGQLTGRSEISVIKADFNGPGTPLKPGSVVAIRQRPNLAGTPVIYFSGAVQRPGAYSLSKNGEKLNAVFGRVGGLAEDAMPRFGMILREDLNADKGEVGLYKKIESSVLLDSGEVNTVDFEPILRTPKDTIAVNFMNWNQLARIGLQDGDTVFIPREMNIIMVRGQVKNQGGHAFVPGKRASYYLRLAGGYSRGVNSQDVVVVYANGQSAEIRYALGFIPIYPRVYSNTTITVLSRPEKKGGLNAGEMAAYTSSLASISSITLGLIYLLRP